MEITLEQSLASAVHYIQNRSDQNAKLYFDDLPENFFVPSIYFPVPRTVSRKSTLQTYLSTIHMEAWFMASTDWLAYEAAENVRDCLLLDNCVIGLMEKDGTPAGRGIHVDDVEVNTVDKGIVCLSFGIKDYFSREDEQKKATNIVFLHEAWRKATTKQRIEEEVQEEWLKKAMENL